MQRPPISPDAPWLAPLAGYSDLPFRMLCRGQGAAAACTEMVSVRGLLFGGEGTGRLLATAPGDEPLVVQLFGADPEEFRRVMPGLLTRGFRFFDLNSGCPVRKVLKTGSGSALLAKPGLLTGIVRAMAEAAGPGRVGVKIRLGFELSDDAFLDLGPALEAAGAAWLTLHPRYGRQLFTGQASWPRVAELKARVSVPVLVSGDLFTAEDGVRCLAETGADGLMFARGTLADPSIFARYLALRRGRIAPPRTGEALAALVREHVRLARDLDGTPKAFRKTRALLPRYAKGLDNIRGLRQRLVQCRTWDELLAEAQTIAELAPADGRPDFQAMGDLAS